jgi:hypothetical protein
MAEVSSAMRAIINAEIRHLQRSFEGLGKIDDVMFEKLCRPAFERVARAYAESGRQGKINCFCEMPDCPQCSPLPIPSSTNTESGQDEYRRGLKDAAKAHCYGCSHDIPLVAATVHRGDDGTDYRCESTAILALITDSAERSHAGQEEK